MKKVILFSSVMILLSVAFQNCSQVQFNNVPVNKLELGSQMPTEQPMCVDPIIEKMEPVLLWDWYSQVGPDSRNFPNFNQVMSSPTVADLNNDGVPEVVFASWNRNTAELSDMTDFYASESASKVAAHRRNGVLRIVNGKTGQTLVSVGDIELAPPGDHTPLLVDLDRDGKVEIVYPHFGGKYLVALNHDGTLRWTFSLPQQVFSAARGLNAFDVDKDGYPEIAVARYVVTEVDREPVIKFELESTGYTILQQVGVSLDGGQTLSIVDASKGVYSSTGALQFSFSAAGNIGVGNLIPENAGLEVAVISSGVIRVYARDGQLLREINLNLDQELQCGTKGIGGGTISIANFDGNTEGRVQMAVATGRYLSVIDSDGKIVAKSLTRDCSSLVTGITTFDFNGDKQPEILYADEQYFRVYYLKDGELKAAAQILNPSGTLLEYPVVADITGDKTSEILVVANNYVTANAAFYDTPEELEAAKLITGVRAFTSKNGAWMPTRPIWNQFDYIPGAIDDRGAIVSDYKNLGSDILRRNLMFSNGQELTCK